jgi:hypothetical protein
LKTDNQGILEEKKSSSDLYLMKLKAWLKDYYLLVIVGVLISFSLLLVFVPFSKEIFSLRGEISKNKKDLELLSQKESMLDSMDESELNSQVDLLESALPSEKPALYIIDILNASSQKFGLKLGSFEFSPGSLATNSAELEKNIKAKSGIDSIEVDVEVSGDFDNLLTYIDYLENALPLMKARAISFSTANLDKEVDATLGLDVYYLLPPETIGKTSDQLKETSASQKEVLGKVGQYTKVVSRSLPTTTYPLRDDPFDY